MRVPAASALVCAAAALAGCGAHVEPVALPSSAAAYRSLTPADRLAAAAACRDRAAAAARGIAQDQLRDIDPRALRAQLELASTIATDRRPFAKLCAERVPFVTPGVAVTFAGATDSGDAFTYQTRSDKPLTIRGTVSPAGHGGYVVARRESGRPKPFRAGIGSDGRFVMPAVRLRKVADNSFVVAIHAPPNALRALRFSAICVDCLASGSR